MSGEEQDRYDVAVLGHKFPVSAKDVELTQRAADHVNGKAEYYRGKYNELTGGQLAALVALDVAEDLFREREQFTGVRRDEEDAWSEAQAKMKSLLKKLDSADSATG